MMAAYESCEPPLSDKDFFCSMIILIDNYDSFTWNLWHFLTELGADVKTIRNDACSVDDIMAMKPSGLVISPGPGTPDKAGICIPLIQKAAGTVPILGVCLGHQAICEAFGGTLRLVSPPVHGKLSLISHQNSGLFEGIEQNIPVTRYHSLVADEARWPDCLVVDAETAAGQIMGCHHKDYEIYGVQFHPESIASVGGYRMLLSFLSKTGMNGVDEIRVTELESQILRLDEKFPEQVHA